MEPAKENMTMRIFSRILLLVSFVLAGVLLAHAQQPSQSAAPQKQQERPAPAKAAPAKPAAKVWTDDDLTSLRSPADDYQMQQEEEKKAQAAAAQASSKPVADPSMPKTVQEADSMIADKSRYLTSEQDYLQRLQQKLKDTSVTGIEKERLEWRLKSHTATTQTLQSQIKQLEADKAALAKKTASGNSTSAPPQS
jgi:hypothetical protein